MNRDRSPIRYAPWLARDVAAGPGVLYVVITAVVCVIVWRLSQAAGMGSLPTPERMQGGIFDNVLLVTCLIAVGGMVSGDMHGGYYRAWFSKPMPTWWYYLQRWLLGMAAVLLVPVLFGLGLVIIFGSGTGLSAPFMGTIALGYLLYAGSVLLLSVFTRRDWLLVFILATAQRAIGSLIEMNVPVNRALKAAWQALPPYHLIQPDRALPETAQLVHGVAYGLGMVLLALVLLRVKPLGSGGRA